MPLTPKFSVTQDEAFVIVKIRIPYVRVSAAEMICDDNDFSFYCHPYLLKLTFPGLLDGDDEDKCKAVYDADEENGTITAFLPKRTHGEVFPDLDLTTLLMQVAAVDKSTGLPPLIEVVGGTTDDGADAGADAKAKIGADADDIVSTEAEETNEEDSLLTGLRAPHYGFNRAYSKLLLGFREELVEMLELNDPDKVPESDRRALRVARERSLYAPERYLADLFGAETDTLYADGMHFEPFWAEQWTAWKALENEEDEDEDNDDADEKADAAFPGFDEAESQLLKTLPNKQYLLARGSRAEREALLGLMDILFAFCFEFRITRGEFSVESPHNITRLSALLSWLDAYKESTDCAFSVVCNACRRGVIYPYLRSWKLCRKVLADVAKVLYLGKRCVLKCLLNLQLLYSHTDSHYMLNKMFIDDYCVWLQRVDTGSLDDAADEWNEAKRRLERSEHHGKGQVGLLLPELEAWALSQDDELSEIPSELRFPHAIDNAETMNPPPIPIAPLHDQLGMLKITPPATPPFEGRTGRALDEPSRLSSEAVPTGRPLISVLSSSSTD